MADYTLEIAALRKAIASGATRVQYDGRTVDYDSYDKLQARLSWLEQQQTGAEPRPMAGYVSFDRDD